MILRLLSINLNLFIEFSRISVIEKKIADGIQSPFKSLLGNKMDLYDPKMLMFEHEEVGKMSVLIHKLDKL
jgi:hypothetical protein